MSNIVFAAISPHPPIILPSLGSEEDRKQVKKTTESLDKLGEELKKTNPDSIIISSPHSDWGFDVPLYFLAQNFKGEIKTYLMGNKLPEFYFEEGKRIYKEQIAISNKRFAVIASGDLSHCLREDGPYGFHPEGPNFDKDLMESLRKKDIDKILKLDDIYPMAGECGLGSFSFLLGILEESGTNYKPEILSYEAPFGVGYLVANFKL